MGRMDGKVVLLSGAARGQGRSHAVRLAQEGFHYLPIRWVEPDDISNAVLLLACDEARYITGAALPVDAGSCLK